MSNKDNGGPAFPVEMREAGEYGIPCTMRYSGMTLRDYFAAKAMQGLCSNQEWLAQSLQKHGSGNLISAVASASYEMADAMMEARK